MIFGSVSILIELLAWGDGVVVVSASSIAIAGFYAAQIDVEDFVRENETGFLASDIGARGTPLYIGICPWARYG